MGPFHGASGLGPSVPSKPPFALAAKMRLVVKTMEAVPTIAPATPQPIATASPDDDFGACSLKVNGDTIE